ncbi:MAG TPA: type VI secretion system tube protein Hcp [Candidatus Saccharimonadales bacterium]|nr:type VI secretion system tube protein Hcp [Candidatus Saccharimonadales bacterium]
MSKKISWRKALPVIGIGLLSVGAVSFAASNSSTSAHDGGDWHKGTQYSIKLAGIEGDGRDGAINLDAYRIMEDEPSTQQQDQNTTALSDLGDNNIRIIAESSKASPMLFEKANSGATIPEATLKVRKGGNNSDYLTIKMTDVMISSYQNSGSDENNSVDEVVFDYATLSIEHNEGSPFQKGWDFRNKHEL